MGFEISEALPLRAIVDCDGAERKRGRERGAHLVVPPDIPDRQRVSSVDDVLDIEACAKNHTARMISEGSAHATQFDKPMIGIVCTNFPSFI